MESYTLGGRLHTCLRTHKHTHENCATLEEACVTLVINIQFKLVYCCEDESFSVVFS